MAENEQKVEEQEVEKKDIQQPEKEAEHQEVQKEVEKEVVTQPEINDDLVREYLSKDPEKFKDIFKPEVKEVNPYEGLLDDDDKEYFAIKKQNPTLTRGQFAKLKINYDEVSSLELSRERVMKESGIKNLSVEKIDEHLEAELGIDDIKNMTSSEEIKLARYAKSLRDEYKAEQAKYKQPVEKKQPESKPEYVKLDNGSVMLKSDYEKQELNRQKHIEDAKEAVNSVTGSSFKIVVGEGDDKKELNYGYEFSEADKQSLLSDVSDLGKLMSSYQTKEGYNHKQFNEDLFWLRPENREKAISAIVMKAVAENTEEVLKARGNVNFENRSSLPQNTGDLKTRNVPITEIFKQQY